MRGAVGTIYFGNTCQLVIAILIFGNFVSSVAPPLSPWTVHMLHMMLTTITLLGHRIAVCSGNWYT